MRDERTFRVIGAAMEVHRELGCGFLEPVYQEAMERELVLRGIPFQAQPMVQIMYKGQPLHRTYQPDFLCFDEIVVEIKALAALTTLEEAQVINYLKATGKTVGLLINFGSRSLQQKRFIYDLKSTTVEPV